jgi:hypothetical protein
LNIEVEEYAVYSVLLNQVHATGDTDQVIIREETSLDRLRDSIVKEDLTTLTEATDNEIAKDVSDNFQAANRRPRLLSNRFSLKVKCVILGREEMAAISDPRDGWNWFYTNYPHQSLITLSRIGFNREMDQAVVYTSQESGGKTGRGEFVFLIKERNVWVIKQRMASWVS